MHKKLGLFIIIGFLSMQVLTFLHMTEYGIDEHEHNSNICQIYMHHEHTKYNAPNEEITLQIPEYAAFTPPLTELLFVRSESYRIASPRGSPLFSV